MGKQPTFEEIRSAFDDALQQASRLISEKQQIDFVAEADLALSQQKKAGLLSQDEYQSLSRKLSLYAKEAFSAKDLMEDLRESEWQRHR